jgi:hypothetical protein
VKAAGFPAMNGAVMREKLPLTAGGDREGFDNRYSRAADQLPNPLFKRHEFDAPVYDPDADVNARFAVPVKLIVLSIWLSWKVKLLPINVPEIDASVPQEAAFPVNVVCPANCVPLCVRFAVN